MTRSVCDWTKSSWVLPHPEISTFEVPPGAVFRAVLASDGLWDVCTTAEAAAIAHGEPTAEAAANRLLELARRVYLGDRGLDKMGDDTTVLVVDLNPSNVSAGARRASVCKSCEVQ
jgi:serine/threonine protein phosphatase PrpC